MYNRKYTPENITSLNSNEIFVFGSNLEGSHGGGAAKIAYKYFGAIWGQGVGLQGQSYAIPTMVPLSELEKYVDAFVNFAFSHRELTFYVPPIGCSYAGYTPYEIAPFFLKVIDLPNVILPKSFVDVMHNHSRVTGVPAMTWDSRLDFLTPYNKAKAQLVNGDRSSYDKIKQLRCREFRNTVILVNNGFYFTEENARVNFDSEASMVEGTRFFHTEIQLDQDYAPEQDTIIDVQNIDCLECAVNLIGEGYNPAVLNMASRRNPGGGVATGAGAQEETIFRRTNLFRSLYQFADYAGNYGVKKSHSQYPLDRDFGGVYTPGVTLFREDESHGYKLMYQPVKLSFISVAGMNRPKLTPDGLQIIASLTDAVKNKIRTILRIGIVHNHDSLVLGALGCGAFRNPPRHIAQLFHEVLNETEFHGRFAKIVFAILEDHNSRQIHNPEGNYLPFYEEFVNNHQ